MRKYRAGVAGFQPSWPKIAAELGVSVGTIYEAAHELSKIHLEEGPVSTSSVVE